MKHSIISMTSIAALILFSASFSAKSAVIKNPAVSATTSDLAVSDDTGTQFVTLAATNNIVVVANVESVGGTLVSAPQGNVFALAGNTQGVVNATNVVNHDGKIFLTAAPTISVYPISHDGTVRAPN